MLKKVFLILSTIISIPVLSSESKVPLTTTYVFCSPYNDRPNWRWAVDSNNNYVTASGYWKIIHYAVKAKNVPNCKPFSYVFVITPSEFNRVSSFCKNAEYTQPADHSTSSWFAFSVDGRST
ncbi:hypothetical protein JCM31447_11360 [Fluviispira sanaruensis]|uniref:Secreted protein n=1 Tax=Fluviispira sanaruensis TaxID=2493639 RepID=A0A4P2VL76_FLUSA|nr:hypothetical protein JCM31447_11360 [Fluviispira sanaruensis]